MMERFLSLSQVRGRIYEKEGYSNLFHLETFGYTYHFGAADQIERDRFFSILEARQAHL